MSGPKGYGYSVISAAELQRREDDAREGRCRHQALALASLSGELKHYGVSGAPVVQEPTRRTHDSLIIWESALERAIAATQHKVDEASAVALVRTLSARRAPLDVSGINLGEGKRQARGVIPGDTGTEDRARLDDEVRKLAQMLARLRDRHVRDELSGRAFGVLALANLAQARGDLLTVKSQVTAALRAQECTDLALQAVLGIAHLDSPAADELRGRAATTTNASDVGEIRSAVTALLEADRRARDASFVEAALVEVLAELGFSVGEAFELPNPQRQVVLVDHADHPGYGLRLQVNPVDGKLYTRVVAEGGTSAEDDARAEAATCTKVRALAAGLKEHGVSAELQFERQPGERPVDRREVPTTAQASRRQPSSRRTTRPQERSAG